jgi:Holliday junction resolvase
LEWAARDELRRRGFLVVRSAGSKTPIDLVALNDQEVLVIQVKKDAGDVAAAVSSLAALVVPAQVRREVWARESGGWRIVTV